MIDQTRKGKDTMHSKTMNAVTLCALLVAAVPAVVHAQCPTGFATLDLKTGAASSTLPAGIISYHNLGGAGAPTPAPAAGCGGWKMAALKISIPATCAQANIVVEYESLGVPPTKGWTVNLGDSPTNDGFAGDAGSTANNAELWILGEDLSLVNGGNNPAVINNPLVLQHLALTNAALRFAVKNQSVSWGNPYTLVQTPATKFLFAIPDTTVPAADQRAIYLGLNRVILGASAFGPNGRNGCGARRALISFQ
jgi:hypothetical protein